MALALRSLTVLAGCALGTAGEGGGFDFQRYIPGGEGGAPAQQGGFDYSHYMKGGGGDYSQYMQGGGLNYSQYMGGGGDYSRYMQGTGSAGFNYSQYVGGGAQGGASYGKYEQYMQGGGAGFNYSQYMGGGGDYSQYMQSGGGDYSQYMQGGGGGFNYSEYMGGGAQGGSSYGNYQRYMQGGGAQGGASYGNYQQYMQGGGAGFNYSQYMQGGGADFNYSQYMGGGGDYLQYMRGHDGYYRQYMQSYLPEEGDPYLEERLARAKGDANYTLQQLRTLLDQVSNASADAEEQDVRQHMFAALTDGERDASARWQSMRQEFHDLHQQFQRDGANWSQEERRNASRRAELLNEKLESLEVQLQNSTGRVERFVSDFVEQRALSDEDKARSLVSLARLRSMEVEGLGRSLGKNEGEAARDIDTTAQGLASDVSDAAARLARSVEALARRSEESVRQCFRDDRAHRRAELREMEPAEDEKTPVAAAALAETSAGDVIRPDVLQALSFVPMLVFLTFHAVKSRSRLPAAADEGCELSYYSSLA